jgi:hypothetical protein
MSFWVIFDASQLVDYYADVHNIIALPPGATIRYDYHRKYLTDRAIQFAGARVTKDAHALLLYEQKNVPYKRSSTESKPVNLNAPCVRVATRLGTILNVVCEGDRYYFDIQVGKYPAQTPDDLSEILNGLELSHPWFKENNGFADGKFVCISDADDAYTRIGLGNEDQKWQSVVNGLSHGGMQFAGDVFWRLNGPLKGAGTSIREPHVVKHCESGVLRRADAVYTIPRGTTFRFELTSDVGRYVAGRLQYEAEINSSDNTAVRLSGVSLFPLRRYSTQMVQFRAESAEKFGKGSADLSFTTLPKQANWPGGPSFRLHFNTRENRIRLWIGIILAVLGIIALIAGKSEYMKDQKELALKIEIAGALIDLLAAALLTRKLSLPGA